jgi:hypothetical protein
MSTDRKKQIFAALAKKNKAIAAAGRNCKKHRSSRRLKGGRCFACYQQAWQTRKKWIAVTPGAEEAIAQDRVQRRGAARERARQYQCALRRADPEKYRASERARSKTPRRKYSLRARILLTKYGLTHDQYEALCSAQGGRCAICRTDTPRGRGGWAIDHDHQAGKVRGLLCTKCNTGVGLFDDDPARLRAAIKYLWKHAIKLDDAELLVEECDALGAMLVEKSKAYGSSWRDPLRIFSKADPEAGILVRLDDKLSRLARGSAAGEDVELDILGYLILLRVARRLKSEAS